jgi:RNA-binding motif X-linked protein 2
MNTVRSINRLNEKEIELGLNNSSWHDAYKSSAYIYIGGLDSALTEGDILTVFSQYGEPVDIDLARDELTGQSRGFCFLAYEDQRSTVLAVDNLNGANLSGRTLRVDHKLGYFRKEKKKEGEDSGNESDEEKKQAPAAFHPELIKALYGGPKDPEKEAARQKRREERQIQKAEKRLRKEEKRKAKEEKKRKREEQDSANKKHKGPQKPPTEAPQRPASPPRRPLSERDHYELIYGYKKD